MTASAQYNRWLNDYSATFALYFRSDIMIFLSGLRQQNWIPQSTLTEIRQILNTQQGVIYDQLTRLQASYQQCQQERDASYFQSAEDCDPLYLNSIRDTTTNLTRFQAAEQALGPIANQFAAETRGTDHEEVSLFGQGQEPAAGGQLQQMWQGVQSFFEEKGINPTLIIMMVVMGILVIAMVRR